MSSLRLAGLALALGVAVAPAPGSRSWAQPAPGALADGDPPEQGETAIVDDTPPPARVSCLDDADEGYRRKGVQKRDFLKRHRFELTALGGLYASDVMSSSYEAGGSLAFFPSEDLGVEALVTYAPVSFKLEDPFTAFDRRQRVPSGRAVQAMAGLRFSPVHAKLKLNEETIVHADLFFVAGAGRTFHDSVQGWSGEVGLGASFYLTRLLSLRLDLRDFVLPQEVLGRARVSHNLAILGGLSLWLF